MALGVEFLPKLGKSLPLTIGLPEALFAHARIFGEVEPAPVVENEGVELLEQGK